MCSEFKLDAKTISPFMPAGVILVAIDRVELRPNKEEIIAPLRPTWHTVLDVPSRPLPSSVIRGKKATAD